MAGHAAALQHTFALVMWATTQRILLFSPTSSFPQCPGKQNTLISKSGDRYGRGLGRMGGKEPCTLQRGLSCPVDWAGETQG